MTTETIEKPDTTTKITYSVYDYIQAEADYLKSDMEFRKNPPVCVRIGQGTSQVDIY